MGGAHIKSGSASPNTHTRSLGSLFLLLSGFIGSVHWRFLIGPSRGGGWGGAALVDSRQTGRGRPGWGGGVSLPMRCQVTHTFLFTSTSSSSSYLAVLFQTAGSQSVGRSVSQSASPEQEVVKSTLALGGFDTSRGRDGGRVLGKKKKKNNEKKKASPPPLLLPVPTTGSRRQKSSSSSSSSSCLAFTESVKRGSVTSCVSPVGEQVVGEGEEEQEGEEPVCVCLSQSGGDAT